MNKINVDSFWLPKASSTIAGQIDAGWNLVLWISVVFFLIVCGAVAYFSMKYKGDSYKGPPKPTHNLPMELILTGIPLAICMGLFVVGFRGYMDASVAPAEALEIQGTGAKWLWTFTYPNGTVTSGELVLPKGRPVKMILSSKDVIHSFFIPEFRVKQDVVPSQYTTLWFEPTDVEETVLECTQYCGTGHSDMLAKVRVLEEAKFNEWMENGGDDGKLPPADLGKKLYQANGCAGCHSLTGARMTGPSFKGLFGKTENLTGGATVKVDENYIRESILNPTAKVVDSFQPVMPVFKGVLKDKQIDALIAFIKTQQ